MNLSLRRFSFTPLCTLGLLSVDTVPLCFVLEDCDRFAVGLAKQKGRTCIEVGDYQIKFSMSKRFQRVLPELQAVPQFTGIRIHPGNSDQDTEGCLLPGFSADIRGGRVLESRPAFAALFSLLQSAPLPHAISISRPALEANVAAWLKQEVLALDRRLGLPEVA